MSEDPSVRFVDDPHAPEVLVDEAVGYFHFNGVVKITLAAARIDHSTVPGPVNRVVIGRLAMSVPAAQNLCLSLYDFLVTQGMDPKGLVKSDHESVQ